MDEIVKALDERRERIGRQLDEMRERIGRQLDEMPGAIANALERRIDLCSAMLALLFVVAVGGYMLGLVHHHNRHEGELDQGRECLSIVGQQPGVQAVPLPDRVSRPVEGRSDIKGQGGRR